MPSFEGQLPRLDGLLALSRQGGVDVRPTLARVLTDLFVATTTPTAAESARYAELMTHLLGQVDVDTRVVIAEKLAAVEHAPQSVIERLLADVEAVAAPVLARLPVLAAADLWAWLDRGEATALTAIASRPDLDATVVRAIASRRIPLAAEALARNPAAPLDRNVIEWLAQTDGAGKPVAAALAARRGIDLSLLAPFALDLPDAPRRSLIRAFLSDPRRRIVGRQPRVEAPQLVLDGIEQAALGGDADRFDAHLAALFEVDTAAIERLVVCPDMLAMALTALGMPPDQTIRVLMFACPGAGRSVATIRDLDSLVHDANRIAAGRLVRAALHAPPPTTQPRHVPQWVESSLPNRGDSAKPAEAPADERSDRPSSARGPA